MINLTYQYLTIFIALVWLLVASVQDIKKREIANWLSFSLLAIGISMNIFLAIISKTYSNLINLACILPLLILISLSLYYCRIFGGGDAKLLIALSPFLILMPSFFHNPINLGFGLPIVLIFLLNVIFIGSFYGIFFSLFLAIKNRAKFLNSLKRKIKHKKTMLFVYLSLAVSLVSLSLFFVFKNYSLLVIFLLLFIFPLLLLFIKAVEESSMIILIGTDKLTEGDWLAKKIKIKNRWIKPSEGLSLDEIKLLKKYKNKILIKQGIPFVPVFFLAFIASLFFNLLLELSLLFA